MTQLIDFPKLKKQSKRRFFLHIASLVLLIASVITGSIFLLIYSPLDYTWYMLANIFAYALLITFLIFYFINIFPIVLHYYRFYKGYNGTNVDNRRRMVFVEEVKNKTFNNVVYHVLRFSFREGEEEFLEDLFMLDDYMELKKDQPYRLTTYHNVIVKVEAI